MKNLTATLMVMIFAFGNLIAKDRVSPHTTVKGDHMSVTYGRPSKKGREVFGKLVPYGQVWRTGADEATEIMFDKDGMFGGKQIKAGTYALFTIPGKDEWTVILNSKLGEWGAFSYESNKDKDVCRFTVKPMHVNNTVEQFTITPDKGNLKLEWENTVVIVNAQF
jgi:Protein of unknown function (DUF2911)